MDSLEHHLRDTQYANWVKNGLALKIANETVKPHVVNELRAFHSSIIDKCSRGSTLKDEIKKSHQHSNPSFYISDDSRWSTDPWEVGKCYMPPMRRYGSCTQADADFSVVVNIIINNCHFETLVTCDLSIGGNIFDQGRNMRNIIMHSNNLRVNDSEFNQNMDLLIQMLEAFNPELTGLNEAVEKIRKLKTGNLTLSLDDVLDVRREAIYAILGEVERGKCEIRNEVEVGTLTIIEGVEEAKQEMNEEAGRLIDRLRLELEIGNRGTTIINHNYGAPGAPSFFGGDNDIGSVNFNSPTATDEKEQIFRANFVVGCRHALLELLHQKMVILRPKRSTTWTLQDFLEKIEWSPEIKCFSERHREVLYPITNKPNTTDKWDMFLLCQILLVETTHNIPNNLILFIKDLKTTRDKLLENPGSVSLEDLLRLCEYLEEPLKQSTREIFNRNTTEPDTVLVHSVLEAWKRNENDFEMQRVNERFLNENKTIAKTIDTLRSRIEQLEEQKQEAAKDLEEEKKERDKRLEEQKKETDKRLEEQKKETDKRFEEQKRETNMRLEAMEALLMARSAEESADKGARPKTKITSSVELIPKNCCKVDSLKIQENITSKNNNLAKENGSIKRFNEEMEIDDTKPKQGSIIFEVTCGSITQLIAFWDKCMDGRAVEALSDVRDTYREFTNCKELEFDVILSKKEVERCIDQIVDDLKRQVNAKSFLDKLDPSTLFKRKDTVIGGPGMETGWARRLDDEIRETQDDYRQIDAKATEETRTDYVKVVQSSRIRLVDELYPEPILDEFMECDFLPATTIRDIQELRTTSEKNRVIIDNVRKRGPTGYQHFKKILRKSSQGYIADFLERKEIDIANEPKGPAVHAHDAKEADESPAFTTERNVTQETSEIDTSAEMEVEPTAGKAERLVERSEQSANEEEADRLVKFLRQVAENLEGGQISVVKQHLDVIVQHAQAKDKKGFDDAVETFINTATFQSGISVNLVKQALRGFLIMLEEPAFGVLVAQKINSIEQEEKKEVTYSAESSKVLVAGPSTVKSSVLIEEDIEVGAVDDAQGLDKIRRIQEQEKEKAASDPTLKSLDHPEARVFPQKSTGKQYEMETSTSSKLDVSDRFYLRPHEKLPSDVKKPAFEGTKAHSTSEFEAAQKRLGISEKPETHQFEADEPSDPKAKLKSSKEMDVSYGEESPK